MLKKTLFSILLLNILIANAAFLSPSAKVSILTEQPGEELYSTFGHTAIRICDTVNKIDLVFNYGTFDFNEPNFYLKFIGGRLNYMLSIEEFDGFYSDAMIEGRGLVEQELNFTQQQKDTLLFLLEENYKPENRNYRYDFFYDNCSSRIRDIIAKAAGNEQLYKNYVAPKLTFRQHYTMYVIRHQPWSVFGIDLLLGAKIDPIAPARDAMFLPDNLKIAIDSGVISNNVKLVKSTIQLIPNAELKTEQSFFSPFLIMFIILIIGLLSMLNTITNKVFNAIFFFIIGILGIALCFTSTLSWHSELHSNYNILWALPLYVLVPFVKNKRILLIYFSITGIINISLLLFWPWLPQCLNFALIPIIALLVAKAAHEIYKSRA